MFAAWDKKSRGRFAAHPDIEVLPGVEKWIGKVVFVLDDVTTTNYTLQASVLSSTALEIHCHGVCYVKWHIDKGYLTMTHNGFYVIVLC